MKKINICGEYITHKSFGRGQITENNGGVVTVLFCETKEIKKFIYPSAVGTFLLLENASSAKQYADEIALKNAADRKCADDRLESQTLAIKERSKLLKKPAKKPAKKTVKKEAE